MTKINNNSNNNKLASTIITRFEKTGQIDMQLSTI